MSTSQDFSKEILSDLETNKVIAFAQDKFLFDAVKKYVLAVAVTQGVFKKGEPFQGNLNYALHMASSATDPRGMPRTDEELGQNVRALATAVQLVESGFNEIAEMKKVEPIVENKTNPAE